MRCIHGETPPQKAQTNYPQIPDYPDFVHCSGADGHSCNFFACGKRNSGCGWRSAVLPHAEAWHFGWAVQQRNAGTYAGADAGPHTGAHAYAHTEPYLRCIGHGGHDRREMGLSFRN